MNTLSPEAKFKIQKLTIVGLNDLTPLPIMATVVSVTLKFEGQQQTVSSVFFFN